jgi:uncharacterized protein YciI
MLPHMTNSLRSIGIALALCALPAAAAEPPKHPEKKFEFEQFTLVLLKRPPNPPKLEENELGELQKQHLAHLTKMGDSGKMVIAGPFGDQRDQTYRGACIYRLPIEEARKLAESDPMVKAGRLMVEAVTWHVGKGYMTFPKAPPVEPK